jgi:hypothetical protein
MKALLRSNNTRKNGLDFGLIRALATKNGCDQLAAVSKPKKKKRIEDKVYYVLRLFGCLN